MSAAIADLATLLAQMRPRLHHLAYSYVTMTAAPDATTLTKLAPLALFREVEGYSGVVETAVAERSGLPFAGPFALITLQVLSSLSAVGLTAAVATALANAGISANVIAAYHHDHVLVPTAEGERAIAVLEALSAAADDRGGSSRVC